MTLNTLLLCNHHHQQSIFRSLHFAQFFKLFYLAYFKPSWNLMEYNSVNSVCKKHSFSPHLFNSSFVSTDFWNDATTYLAYFLLSLFLHSYYLLCHYERNFFIVWFLIWLLLVYSSATQYWAKEWYKLEKYLLVRDKIRSLSENIN